MIKEGVTMETLSQEDIKKVREAFQKDGTIPDINISAKG
jgi:hypothetical protein